MSEISETVEQEWGGELRRFKLAIGELREVQARTNRGPEELRERMLVGTWFVDEVRWVLRFGLEGAGMSAGDAERLVVRYFDERGSRKVAARLAALILTAALFVPEAEAKPGKPEAAKAG